MVMVLLMAIALLMMVMMVMIDVCILLFGIDMVYDDVFEYIIICCFFY
jgi:hypothetical protein